MKQEKLLLLFPLTGIYGLLFLAEGVDLLQFYRPAVYGFAAVFGLALWVLAVFAGKFLAPALAAAAAGWTVAFFLAGQELLEEFRLAGRILAGEYSGEAVTVTTAVLFLIPVVLSLIFFLEYILHAHWLLYLFTSALLLAAPLVGVEVSLPSVILLAVFQILFWTQAGPAGKRSLLEAAGWKQIDRAKLKIMCIFLAAVLAVSSLLILPNADLFSQAVYQAEGFAARTLQRSSGMDDNPITGGAVSGGNNYRTGTVQLEVETARQPRETLYLKDFTGGEYLGGRWEEADDEALFVRMADTMGWDHWESWIRGMFFSMYYVLNSEFAQEDAAESNTIIIRHSSGEYYWSYTPYYSQWTNQRWDEENPQGYAFRFYEPNSMHVDWSELRDGFELPAQWYRQIQDAYMDEIQTAYTTVPRQMVPRLAELVEANPLTDLNDITELILGVLHQNASYTLTPGRSPVNEDIVEYFLFDNHQGYCVHYASAAALMYRMFGIPARYAAGYAIQPEQFEEQDNGIWRAEATDEAAHAWVEIFVEDYGWVPVEVTPLAGDTPQVSYPGFDASILQNLSDISVALPDAAAQEDTSSESGQTSERGERAQLSFSLDRYENQLWAAGALILPLLLLIPLFLDVWRIRILKKLRKKNCAQIFSRYLKMLHSCGILKEATGEEEEFPRMLSRAVPLVSFGEAARMQENAMRCCYGAEMTDEKEQEFLYGIYLKTARKLLDTMDGWRRFRFRFLKAFG